VKAHQDAGEPVISVDAKKKGAARAATDGWPRSRRAPGTGERTQTGLVGDDRRVGVGVEVLDHGAGKLVGAGCGRVELAEQGEAWQPKASLTSGSWRR
jgi:hypothetical protein